MTEAKKTASPVPPAKPVAAPAAKEPRSFIVERAISIRGILYRQGDKITEANAPKEVIERYRKLGRIK